MHAKSSASAAVTPAVLEHVNVTVTDPDRTAALLADLFGWRVRWQGPSKSGGRSVHVGAEHSYVALYSPGAADPSPGEPGRYISGLNHIAVTVDDLDATEARVRAAGLTPFNFGSYDPGRRFYVLDPDGIEYEIVSYS